MKTTSIAMPAPRRTIGTPEASIQAFRRKARLGTLHPAIDALLTENDESWNTNRYELRWREDLEHYRTFLAIESHAPSQTAKELIERKLGYWAAAQRTSFREGTLTKDRIARMAKVEGHLWEPFEHTWNAQLAELEQFVSKVFRLPSKRSLNSDEHTLARWVHRQRTLRRAGKLSSKRESSLALIPGIIWEPRDTAWPDSLARYIDFMSVQRRDPTRSLDEGDERQIAEWMHNQRTAKRENRLSAKRIALLESVPGHQWSVRPERTRAS